MKKNVLTIVLVITLSLIVIILGNRSFAFETNGNNIWNVYLNNIKTVNVNGDAFVPYEPEIEGFNIKAFDVIVSKKGDYATFTFDIVNAGTIDAKLVNLTKIEPKCISLEIPENVTDEELVCNNLEYNYYYTKNNKEVNINDIIKVNTKENVTLKVGLKSNIIDEPVGDVQITLFDSTFGYNKK